MRNKFKELLCSIFFLTFFQCINFISNAQENIFSDQRNQMVKIQIEARGINSNKILNAFKKVERHKFVSPELASIAYIDSPLPIEENQTISQPYIVAYMTESLELKRSDKVLEIVPKKKIKKSDSFKSSSKLDFFILTMF